MKPYGSKRSYDTEPRIKVARALEKRRAKANIKEQTEDELHPAETRLIENDAKEK